MTTDEMRAEIEAVYAATLGARAAHLWVSLAQAVSDGITPMSWHLAIPATAEALTRDEFRVQFGDHAGEELASMGLSYGCDLFGALRVQDREAVRVKNRMRQREFIVHAIGWSTKQAPVYAHEQRWPHRIGPAKGEV